MEDVHAASVKKANLDVRSMLLRGSLSGTLLALATIFAALEFVTRDLDNVGAMLGGLGQSASPEELRLAQAVVHILDRFQGEGITEEAARELMAAAKERNAKRLLEAFATLPQKFRDAFDEEMRKLSAA